MIITPLKRGGSYSAIKQFPKNPKPSDVKKEWFIYFDFHHEGTWVPLKRKSEINRVKKFAEKLEELKALKKAFELAMDGGWNPITKEYPKPTSPKLLPDNATIIEALDFALPKCDVAKSTYTAYSHCIRKVKAGIRNLELQSTAISKIRREHIKLILEEAKTIYRWSNREYNKNLTYLQGVLSELIEWGALEYNPAHRIKKKKVYDTGPKFIPYTEAEKKLIHDYLFMNHYGFYVYTMVIYHTGMRPLEVLALQIKDIDLKNGMIRIIPDPTRLNSKTKKVREVQLNIHLLPLIREWIKGIESKEWFVFGSTYGAGKGNRGSTKGRTGDGAKNPDYFKCSGTRIKRDTVTRLWKTIVVEKLGIKKYLYGAKHTGTDDKLIAGVSISAIQEMYGHSSEYMTTRYQTVLKKIHRTEINEKSPAFI